MRATGYLAVVALTLGAIGCGSTSVDVTGSYMLSVTSGDNGCNFSNWTSGASTTGIPLTITESGGTVTATLGGAAGAYTSVILGSDQFIGTSSGDFVTLTLKGTRAGSMNGCAYTVNATVKASLAGDALQGTITYMPMTNNSTDCGVLNACTSVQAFAGTRPPATK